MSKLILVILCLVTSGSFVFAQKAEKDMVSKAWYCSCQFNSDHIVLSADNTNQPNTEIKFSPTGKLLLKNIKRKTVDSNYTFLFKKNTFTLRSESKDSVIILNYTLKKSAGKKAYEFSMKYSSRYISKKNDAAQVLNKFVLIRGKKRKVIQAGDEIAVFSQYKARRNDSINRAVWGIFDGYISDTLIIESDQYVEHNYYKRHTDTLHYIAPLLLDTTVKIKVPVKYITGIYNQREPISSISGNAMLLGLVVGFGSIATSVIAGEGNNGRTFAQIGVFSFLTIPISLTVNVIFSKQKFQINSTRKPGKNWKIERHMPHTIISRHDKNTNAKK